MFVLEGRIFMPSASAPYPHVIMSSPSRWSQIAAPEEHICDPYAAQKAHLEACHAMISACNATMRCGIEPRLTGWVQ